MTVQAGVGRRLRVHALLAASRANGPGVRTVLWVQGCSLGCPGCFNPETHPAVGESVAVDDLFDRIVAAGTEGLTVSGGEPFQQRQAVAALLNRVRSETELSVVLFTGYTWEEVGAMAGGPELAALADVVIAGRFQRDGRLAVGLRGSANKTVHLVTDRYTRAHIEAVPLAEIVIEADGSVVLTGIDPVAAAPVLRAQAP